MFVLGAFWIEPAGAQNPSEVVPELADDGVYIATSRRGEANPTDFSAVIEEARSEGLTFAVVYPDDPQPNTGAFARRIQEASMFDVVLVFGPDGVLGSFVSEDYGEDAIRASAAAREAADPPGQAAAFLTGLLEEPVRERPAIVGELVRWIVILLALLVTGALAEQLLRQFKRQRKRRKLQRAQTEVGDATVMSGRGEDQSA